MALQRSTAPTGARIQLLNAALADQIAAGEVVERPASAVKELVENAIDAGATRVDVELEDGGLTSIRVIDNGGGIHPEDLPLAITRHGTSKVRGPEDLIDIQTLGFRGEALASMAAVAHLSLRSRQPQAPVGAEIRTVPGEVPRPSPVGMPHGTQVEIRGLFSNVPARRKFMRSEATEVGHCSETLLRIGLIHPEVHLVLRHGKRELINLPAGTLDERVTRVLERRGSGPFFAFSGEEDQITVKGWIADPRTLSPGRGGLYIVTRRRVVKERNISQILGQALGEGSTALGCLIVEPPPATVDVNVHPQKSEIRFSDPQRVYAALRRILARELQRAPWAAPREDVGEDMSLGAGAVRGDEGVSAAADGEAAGPEAAIERWAGRRPEPEGPSLRGREEVGDEGAGPRGGRGRGRPRRGGGGEAARIPAFGPGLRAPVGFVVDREPERGPNAAGRRCRCPQRQVTRS
ncbi:MAG: DNA mismatch repair endonuclease MutL [Myxococcales bacterium]|nr:DNA mismatch repair endonuclease MutL [Myxococcales bacterium]